MKSNTPISRKLVAAEILKVAKAVLAAGDYEYVPDPDHKHKPQGGGWEPTDKGWSRNKSENGKENGGKGNAHESPEVKELRELATSSDFKVRYNVARNRRMPVDVLKKLANDEEWGVRYMVAGNPSTPADVLKKLAKDEKSREVRQSTATNPSTPQETLRELAKFFPDEVCRNPSAPEEVLVSLASSHWEDTRMSVARNPKTPSEVLTKLAQDKSRVVRDCAMRNSNIPPEILEKFADVVPQGASENPNATPSVLKKAFDTVSDEKPNYSRYTLYLIANNPNASSDLLEAIATHHLSQTGARKSVCLHPNTSLETLKKLANDKNDGVRRSLFKRPNLPAEVLGELASDEELDIRLKVAGNLFTPTKKLQERSGDEREHIGVRYWADCASRARGEALAFSKTLGKRGRGRNLQELKRDFLANMDPSNYKTRGAFERAKKRVQALSPVDFGRFLKAVAAEDEEAA